MLFGLPNNVEANVIRAIPCLLGSFLLLGVIVGQSAAPSNVTKALICDVQRVVTDTSMVANTRRLPAKISALSLLETLLGSTCGRTSSS